MIMYTQPQVFSRQVVYKLTELKIVLTYLAQVICDQQGRWSRWRPSIALRLSEACDSPKRGELGCTIFDSGGLRSRYPLKMQSNDM